MFDKNIVQLGQGHDAPQEVRDFIRHILNSRECSAELFMVRTGENFETEFRAVALITKRFCGLGRLRRIQEITRERCTIRDEWQ